MTKPEITYLQTVARLSAAFGPSSNAVLMAHLEMLLLLLRDASADPHDVHAMAERIRPHYRATGAGQVARPMSVRHAAPAGKDDEYHYPPDEYERRYGNVFAWVKDRLRNLSDPTCRWIPRDGSWYLYVVTLNNDLIVCDVPMDVTAVILNRTDVLDPGADVVHPALAQFDGFVVRAAGEIGFAVNGDQVAGVAFNTKSGHYRPLARTVEVVKRVLAERFPSPVQVIDIPVVFAAPATSEKDDTRAPA